jgi:hypothetical protein
MNYLFRCTASTAKQSTIDTTKEPNESDQCNKEHIITKIKELAEHKETNKQRATSSKR